VIVEKYLSLTSFINKLYDLRHLSIYVCTANMWDESRIKVYLTGFVELSFERPLIMLLLSVMSPIYFYMQFLLRNVLFSCQIGSLCSGDMHPIVMSGLQGWVIWPKISYHYFFSGKSRFFSCCFFLNDFTNDLALQPN